MENKKARIGSYDKSVRGRKAVLKTEIGFFTAFHKNATHKKVFPAGTIVVAEHEVVGTGLTTFNFKHDNNVYEHVVREGKFEYID